VRYCACSNRGLRSNAFRFLRSTPWRCGSRSALRLCRNNPCRPWRTGHHPCLRSSSSLIDRLCCSPCGSKSLFLGSTSWFSTHLCPGPSCARSKRKRSCLVPEEHWFGVSPVVGPQGAARQLVRESTSLRLFEFSFLHLFFLISLSVSAENLKLKT
jgi:hypothetical protein